MEIYGGKLGESATTWSVGSKISPEARWAERPFLRNGLQDSVVTIWNTVAEW